MSRVRTTHARRSRLVNSGKEDPLAIVPKGFGGVTTVVGVVLFVVVVRALYRMAGREGARS